jgi:large conductance mechanosensitive channel
MLTEFKKFILRGNVVDLAVAVVIGAAFTALVNAFSNDIIKPILDGVIAKLRLFDFVVRIPLTHIHLLVGNLLSAIVTFLVTAGVVFFLIVKPLNKLMELSRRREPTPDPTTRKCPECLGEVPLKATRCMYCTIKLQPATASKTK